MYNSALTADVNDTVFKDPLVYHVANLGQKFEEFQVGVSVLNAMLPWVRMTKEGRRVLFYE